MSETGRTIALYAGVVVVLVYVAVRRSRPSSADVASAIAPLYRPPNFDEMGMGAGGTANIRPVTPAPFVPSSPVSGGPSSGSTTVAPLLAHPTIIDGRQVGVFYRPDFNPPTVQQRVTVGGRILGVNYRPDYVPPPKVVR